MDDLRYTSVEAQVEFGLDAIPDDRTVEVSLRDLLYIQKTLGEFVRFFHQPAHWPTYEAVERYIGTSHQGALHVLWEAYYRRIAPMMPEDIDNAWSEGDFDHPDPPYYFASQEGGRDVEMMDWLQDWYSSMCDGDWEHENVIEISNSDNPGWIVVIDLEGSGIYDLVIPYALRERSEDDWYGFSVEAGRFTGVGGARNLTEVIAAFRSLIEGQSQGEVEASEG